VETAEVLTAAKVVLLQFKQSQDLAYIMLVEEGVVLAVLHLLTEEVMAVAPQPQQIKVVAVMVDLTGHLLDQVQVIQVVVAAEHTTH